jgi:hypothetical protein
LDTVLVAVVIPPPQLNVAPPVVEEAVSVSEVVVQVKGTGGAMLTLGVMMFWVTVVDAVMVQPFAGSVMVTVYVLGVVIVWVAVVMPPPQLKVAPPVVEVAVRVSLVITQVKTVGGLMAALGAVMFWVTVTVAVEVHPLAGLVTVTV